MKYYTEIIPVTLAEKLKEAGMPMSLWQGWATPFISIMEDSEYDWLDKELGNEPSKVEIRYSVPTYAEVFDWVIGQGIFISVAHCKVEYRNGCWYPIVNGKNPPAIDGRDWEHSALLAIEKALELIKEK